MNTTGFVSAVPHFPSSKDASGVVLAQTVLYRRGEESAASQLLKFACIEEARAWVSRQAQMGPGGRPMQVEFSRCLERWERAHWAPGNVLVATMAFVLMR